MKHKLLAEKIQQILVDRGLTLSTAESCTGGRIASVITSIPGSSAYFMGAIVAYQNFIKTELLGVEEEIISQYGVVSKEVVEKMVKGACKIMKSDFAISTSGCAGPGGGTETVPIGTIWIGIGNKDFVKSIKCTTDSGRQQNIENAVEVALDALVKMLNEK